MNQLAYGTATCAFTSHVHLGMRDAMLKRAWVREDLWLHTWGGCGEWLRLQLLTRFHYQVLIVFVFGFAVGWQIHVRRCLSLFCHSCAFKMRMPTGSLKYSNQGILKYTHVLAVHLVSISTSHDTCVNICQHCRNALSQQEALHPTPLQTPDVLSNFVDRRGLPCVAREWDSGTTSQFSPTRYQGSTVILVGYWHSYRSC